MQVSIPCIYVIYAHPATGSVPICLRLLPKVSNSFLKRVLPKASRFSDRSHYRRYDLSKDFFNNFKFMS